MNRVISKIRKFYLRSKRQISKVGKLEGPIFGYCTAFVVRENNFCRDLPPVDGEVNLKKEWQSTNHLTF